MNIKEYVNSSHHGTLKKAAIPDWIPAMKASLTDNYFSDPEWFFESKLDGERVVACKQDGNVTLYSRNKKQINDAYPELEKALHGIKDEWWLDGEVVAFEDANTSFRALQKRMHVKNREEAWGSDVNVYLYLFDCMYAGDYDVRGLPLKERKNILSHLASFQDPLQLLDWKTEHGEQYLQKACENGQEGIIAKDSTSTYTTSRSKKWLKFKCDKQQELVVIGYTDPEGSRTYFGAVLLGYYENGQLRYAGKVGTGFDEDTRADLMNTFETIKTDEPPVDESADEKNAHWVNPELVVQIGFTEWTQDGKLRHPRFLGVRRDKDPKDVVREVS